jgi:hypothetical protein
MRSIDQETRSSRLKFYAPNVGNIPVGWTGSAKKTQKILELIKVEKLDERTLAEIRVQASKLEKGAYKHSKRAYARTEPAAPDAMGTSGQ